MIMSTSMMAPDPIVAGTMTTVARSFYSDTALSVLVKGTLKSLSTWDCLNLFNVAICRFARDVDSPIWVRGSDRAWRQAPSPLPIFQRAGGSGLWPPAGLAALLFRWLLSCWEKEGAEMKVGFLLQKLTNGLGFDGIAWPQGSPDLSSKGMV